MFKEEIRQKVADLQTQRFYDSDATARALAEAQMHTNKQISMAAVTDSETMKTDVSVFINGNWTGQGGEEHMAH